MPSPPYSINAPNSLNAPNTVIVDSSVWIDYFKNLDKQKTLRYATYYRQLRKKGITIRKFNDVMIAGYCINNPQLLFKTYI